MITLHDHLQYPEDSHAEAILDLDTSIFALVRLAPKGVVLLPRLGEALALGSLLGLFMSREANCSTPLLLYALDIASERAKHPSALLR